MRKTSRTIEFHKVTWYSRWAAFLFFLLVLPILTFYIGTQYEQTVGAINNDVSQLPEFRKALLLDSGIVGVVTIGPACKTGVKTCDEKPLSTSLVIIPRSGGAPIQVNVDASGIFARALPAGTYEVRQWDSNVYPRLITPPTVVVSNHNYTVAHLRFESGTR